MVVGFVGLGNMGAPMCERLVRAGHEVHAFDLDEDRLAAARDWGARPLQSAVECARGAEILLTSLPRPDHVEAVMRGGSALAALAPGAVWVDLTTNRVQVLAALAAEAPDGVAVVDSPVTGAVDGARTGRLTLFLGGEDDVLDRVEPLLRELGVTIRCGKLGSGNIVKLVTNQLWFVAAAALGEGFALGAAHGVDLRVLWTAICNSVGDSFVARHDAPSIFADHYDPSFSLDLCMKDLGLIEDLQERVGAVLPLTDAARRAFAVATERYGAGAPELSVARRIEEDAGLSFRLEGEWMAPWEVSDDDSPRP